MAASRGMWGSWSEVVPLEVMVEPSGRIAWIGGILTGLRHGEDMELGCLFKKRPGESILRKCPEDPESIRALEGKYFDGYPVTIFVLLIKFDLLNLIKLRLISGPGCQGRLTAPGTGAGTRDKKSGVGRLSETTQLSAVAGT